MREFIVEADGGSRGNPGPAGYGSVVIDAATGETLVERAEYIGIATNNVAEYRGLLAGLRAARELDPTAPVRVRMDSKLVVEQMSGRWKIKHPDMKPLAMEAARIYPPGQVTYEWIPREHNKHADRLANEAMDAGKRGEQWDAGASMAALTVASPVSPASREPSGPPGDATVGAAKAREALAKGRVGGAQASTPAGEATMGTAAAGGPADSAPAAGGSGGTSASGAAAYTASAGADVGAAAGSASADSLARSADPQPSGAGGDTVAGAQRDGGAAGEADAATATGTGTGAGDSGATASGSGSGTVATTPATTTSDADRRAARTLASPSSAAPSSTSASERAQPSVGWGAAPDLGAPATFVLLRHGETPLTPEKRFSGSGGSDPALSAVGREQAERVAAALARRGTVQHIVASPLARTRETAGAVAARLGLEVTVDDGLRETDFGAWEGLTFGEVRERHPEDLTAWLADPEAEPTGGGESFAATAVRIAAARDKLVAAYAGRTVLLVTHVTPIKTLVRLALGAPPESLFRMELSAASLSVVAYYADGNASVRLLNDTSHLRG
ncbi:bifunctional RNase H/acid phosphatase [Streptomyces sp. NPDC058335]|uniref:bifunctional RNase H/acid phosphatase n=1 Tax=Streptomyces sp. NPDC058335 TaxID=3346451 RepID=UPI0036461DEF